MVVVLVFVTTAKPAFAEARPPATGPQPDAGLVALRVTAAGPGLVRVRGDGVQGVDWDAAGAGTVVVPLRAYAADGADAPVVTVNGNPVSPDDVLPADRLPGEFRSDDGGPPGPAFDDAAYEAAGAWRPGRSPSQRRWALGAVAVIVLTLGVATHADPKRATRWVLLAAAGLVVGIGLFFPADLPTRVLPAAGRPGWEWVWVAGGEAGRDATAGRRVVTVPWSPGLRFVPRSAGHLRAADPVLRCDAGGRPVDITCRATDDGRSVFLRRVRGH